MNLERLIEVLNTEYEIYQKLNQLAKEKETVIVEREVDRLEEIVKEEDDYVTRLQNLEQTRKRAAEEKEITEVIRHADPAQQDKLKQLRDKLTEVTSELETQNQLNRKLLRDALQLLNLNLNLLNAQEQKNTYSKTGKMDSDGEQTAVINEKA